MRTIVLSLLAVIGVLSAESLLASEKSARVPTVPGNILIETVIFSATSADSKPVARKRHAPIALDLPRLFHGTQALKNVKMLWSTNFVTSETTNASGSLQDGFRYAVKVDGDLDVMLAALANDKQVQLIQKPRIQTSHATLASVYIGSAVPYCPCAILSGRTSGTYFPGKQMSDRERDLRWIAQPFRRRYPVSSGIHLGITPIMNAGGHIEMLIRQTFDKIVVTTTITGVGDVLNTQSTQSEASVTVRDGETFLIGGWYLSREDSGAPDLSTIKPVFRHLSTRSPRRELLVLLRARFLPNSIEASTSDTRNVTLQSRDLNTSANW